MEGKYKNISFEMLAERAKELECLYQIDKALTKESISDMLLEVADVTTSGFRYVDACVVTVCLDNKIYSKKNQLHDGHEIRADIIVNDKIRGYIKAAYPCGIAYTGESAFLIQETKLLNAIAAKIAQNIFQRQFVALGMSKNNWETIIELLQNTDHSMLLHVCEQMLAFCAKNNQKLVDDIFKEMNWSEYEFRGEINFPLENLPAVDVVKLSNTLFEAARTFLEDSQIFYYVNLWIYQGKTYELIKFVDKKDSDVREISKALSQYLKAVKANGMISAATQRWLIVELIRRFLTDNPKMIHKIKEFVSVEDFCELLDTFICSPHSTGKVGGKATGFFIAYQIIKKHTENNPVLRNIKIPKTWYISSDELLNLMRDNNLDELNEYKYRDILEIRINYPKVVQTIKNSHLSPYVMNELHQIIDQCEGKPLIIRSSSLLEDQIDSAFSGKYKSLFLTNTGSKTERFNSLVNGILEVLASMFNPDSIQYRKERNLLDCAEQMGVMVQEVVGTRVGPFYFPLYAGVAFSNNELRWSPRVKREDGLVRIVMGLGTRAVDRVGDDFPVLISLGQPDLPVNQTIDEKRRYSPQVMDVIDVENSRFSSISITGLLQSYGNKIPHLSNLLSVLKDDFVSDFNKYTVNLKTDETVVTFDGLIKKTPFIEQVKQMLSLLKEQLGYPVDIEFASDGQNLYLLQCRPQSRSKNDLPAEIPPDIPDQSIVFTANRYVSNGKVSGIKHIVYVDPKEYGNLQKHEDLVNVANAVRELNRLLPRRSFILMGPGRWGSRGDIKLGVQVTYSGINNSSMLIEIAQKKSKHQPELSFGTHFFQDLVEENIKYLPLYPEDEDVVFYENFFTGNQNQLSKVLPDYSQLEKVIKVINTDNNHDGRELVVLMNADLGKAVAYLDYPTTTESMTTEMPEIGENTHAEDDQGWKWRYFMAEQIAEQMDMEYFGVKGIYLFGSTNACTARLNSDIDLLIHFDGTEEQKEKLNLWLEGWSIALSQINYLKTGYNQKGLLDVHYITDLDIEEKNPYAVKINSVYDPAHLLRLRDKQA